MLCNCNLIALYARVYCGIIYGYPRNGSIIERRDVRIKRSARQLSLNYVKGSASICVIGDEAKQRDGGHGCCPDEVVVFKTENIKTDIEKTVNCEHFSKNKDENVSNARYCQNVYLL